MTLAGRVISEPRMAGRSHLLFPCGAPNWAHWVSLLSLDNDEASVLRLPPLPPSSFTCSETLHAYNSTSHCYSFAVSEAGGARALESVRSIDDAEGLQRYRKLVKGMCLLLRRFLCFQLSFLQSCKHTGLRSTWHGCAIRH